MSERILKVSKVKYKDSFVSKIRLSGLWLNELGFSSGKQFLIDYSVGFLKLDLLDATNTINESNSSNEGNNYKFLVSKSSGSKIRSVPEIGIYGLWIGEIGFTIDEKIIVTSDYGLITIKPLST